MPSEVRNITKDGLKRSLCPSLHSAQEKNVMHNQKLKSLNIKILLKNIMEVSFDSS